MPKDLINCERLQLLLGFSLIVCALWFFCVAIGAQKEDYSGVPDVSSVELQQRTERLLREINGPLANDPRQYFRVVVEQEQLQALTNKYRRQMMRGHGSPDALPDFMFADVSRLQIRYLDRFGSERMHAAADAMKGYIDANTARYHATFAPGALSRTWETFKACWFWSFLIALPFFGARLVGERKLVVPELVRPRFYAAAAFWPYAFWRYPRHINPVEQMRRFRQYLAGLLATLFTLGTASAAYGSDRKGDGASGAANTTLVVNDQPRPHVTLTGGIMLDKLVANGTQVHDGPVATGGVTVTYGDWSLNVSGTRSLSRDRGSDETDFIVGRAFRSGRWSFNAQLAFYDIRPLGSTRGGDMISPILSVERPVGHGFTVFATGEAYIMTGGPGGRNGGDVAIGVRTSVRAGPANIDLATRAIYAAGPFHFGQQVTLRHDVAVGIPLSERMRMVFSAKVFTPVAANDDEDRGITASASFNLVVNF
jgi:hypothetical protein